MRTDYDNFSLYNSSTEPPTIHYACLLLLLFFTLLYAPGETHHNLPGSKCCSVLFVPALLKLLMRKQCFKCYYFIFRENLWHMKSGKFQTPNVLQLFCHVFCLKTHCTLLSMMLPTVVLTFIQCLRKYLLFKYVSHWLVYYIVIKYIYTCNNIWLI